MKSKKIISMMLALVMMLALAATAFAAANDKTVITSTYTPPTIDVVVPGAATATINPYGLPVDVTKGDGTTKVSFTGLKIVTSPTAAIKNRMALDLDVSATVTGEIVALPSGSTATPMRLATEALAADATTKSAFVYVQAKPSTSTGEEDAAGTFVLSDKLIDEYKGWAATAYDETKDILVKVGTNTKDKFVTLKAATMYTTTNADATHAAGTFKEFATNSIALIRLGGDVVASPREAWSTDDSFKVTIAYKFTPATAASNP